MLESNFSATSGDFIPTLEVSTSQQIEFGARGSLFKKRLTYDVAYYNMQIDEPVRREGVESQLRPNGNNKDVNAIKRVLTEDFSGNVILRYAPIMFIIRS